MIALTYGIEAWNITRPLTTRALRQADRIIAISAFTAAQLVRSLGLGADRIAVVHNSIDVERFTPGPPSPAVAGKLGGLLPPRLLTVCRLEATERYKGVDTVLRTLHRHRDLCGSYLVIGDGTDRPRLQALATELRVPATFYGRAGDGELPDLFRACDVFVMPSLKEGFGYVFIEALACGVPVVAGNADGSVDALGGGALGLLVDPLDETALATAIRAHVERTSSPDLRDPLRLHQEVTARFGRAALCDRVGAVLRDL
jgi:glycosyltransferase involved in cell wall biosynthesis